MAKKKSLTPLGETEMEILHHVWDLEKATVADVREEILKRRPIAYTTVMTVMKNLFKKGYLDYSSDGPAFVYRARRSAEDVRRNVVSDMVGKVFRGSRLAMVRTLVGDEGLSDVELRKIKKLIDDMESGEEGHDG